MRTPWVKTRNCLELKPISIKLVTPKGIRKYAFQIDIGITSFHQ